MMMEGNTTINNTSGAVNPWDTHADALWVSYTGINGIGGVMCVYLIYHIAKLGDDATSSDVLIGGVALGCALMGIPCAFQCLASMINRQFCHHHVIIMNRAGDTACEVEAFFHVASIITQFGCLMLNSVRGYYAISRQIIISKIRALQLILIVVVMSTIGTSSLGSISTLYLMPAGAYCFFEFTSPVIMYWFVPVMVVSFGVMAFSYGIIFRTTYQTVNRVNGMVNASNNSNQMRAVAQRKTLFTLARRSFVFVLLFFICWFTAIVALFWEVSSGRIHAAHDTTFGVLGSLHNIFMPIVYTGWNTKLRRSIRHSACCVRLRGEVSRSHNSDEGIALGPSASRYAAGDNIPSQGSGNGHSGGSGSRYSYNNNSVRVKSVGMINGRSISPAPSMSYSGRSSPYGGSGGSGRSATPIGASSRATAAPSSHAVVIVAPTTEGSTNGNGNGNGSNGNNGSNSVNMAAGGLPIPKSPSQVHSQRRSNTPNGATNVVYATPTVRQVQLGLANIAGQPSSSSSASSNTSVPAAAQAAAANIGHSPPGHATGHGHGHGGSRHGYTSLPVAMGMSPTAAATPSLDYHHLTPCDTPNAITYLAAMNHTSTAATATATAITANTTTAVSYTSTSLTPSTPPASTSTLLTSGSPYQGGRGIIGHTYTSTHTHAPAHDHDHNGDGSATSTTGRGIGVVHALPLTSTSGSHHHVASVSAVHVSSTDM